MTAGRGEAKEACGLYSPSGGIRPEAPVLIPSAAALAAAALAQFHSAAVAGAGLLSVAVVMAFAYGCLTGLLSRWAVRASQARAPSFAAAMAFLGGAAGFWLSFCAYAGRLRGPGGGEGAGVPLLFGGGLETALRLAARPVEAAGLVLNAGASPWSFMGVDLEGAGALAAWALQWMAFSAALALAVGEAASRPYSEEAGVWLEPGRPGRMLFSFPEGSRSPSPEFLAGLRKGDLGHFLSAPPPEKGQACLGLVLFLHPEAPLAAAAVTLRRSPRRLSGGKALAKYVLAPRPVAEAIAARLGPRRRPGARCRERLSGNP
ncbi:MAG: hypothetical protein LBW85_00670 [Deltaproteobacteria bacterium]|jgi:hypothetical protein|nr:hypothetical protein [Deltaproteobacteria bacterium]